YQRHGWDASHVAAMVANPLSIRNVDDGLLGEIDVLAALDSTRGRPPELFESSSSPLSSAEGVGANTVGESANDFSYAQILQMIRTMGRAFETFPDTYAKFLEEELR